ncbi:MAG: branched-chain amino acid ABC transporter permease [Rhodomicrobiaceae bacterium]
MFRQTPTKSWTVFTVVAGLCAYTLLGGYFARELVIDAAILAMLAISLDVMAGYGGMVSLAHGALLGLGAYAYAVAGLMLGAPPLAAMLAAMAVAALFGAAVGAVASRTRGIFFMMASLAFGQMAYVLVFDARALGGDDGMSGVRRLDLSALGLDLQGSTAFAFFSLLCLILIYAAAAWLLTSGFGRTLCGIRENEDRMRALGVTIWKFKSGAFAFSGLFAGLAGALSAQHTMFVSPELMTWTVSGQALVMVILGGIGTLAGPVVGAVFLVFLKYLVSGVTNYWHMIIGLILILAVAVGGRGLYGALERQIEICLSRLAKRREAATKLAGAQADA